MMVSDASLCFEHVARCGMEQLKYPSSFRVVIVFLKVSQKPEALLTYARKSISIPR